MKDELIKFETAKLLKEKGFKPTSGFDAHGYDGWGNLKVFRGNAPFPVCTQSLLQRWLREVHGIVAIVKPDGQSDAYDYYIKTRGTDISEWLRTKEIYPTYELALESALLEALNLIS